MSIDPKSLGVKAARIAVVRFRQQVLALHLRGHRDFEHLENGGHKIDEVYQFR